MDSWKPGLEFSPLSEDSRQEDQEAEPQAQRPPAAESAPARQLTVPLRVSPGGLEAQLPQLGAPLHPLALQTPHVGGQDAGQPKVLQTLHMEGKKMRRKRDLAPPPRHSHLQSVSGLSHLHDPDLPGDFGQTAVEVVGGQRLPPQSLVLVGPNPGNQRDKRKEDG